MSFDLARFAREYEDLSRECEQHVVQCIGCLREKATTFSGWVLKTEPRYEMVFAGVCDVCYRKKKTAGRSVTQRLIVTAGGRLDDRGLLSGYLGRWLPPMGLQPDPYPHLATDDVVVVDG